MFNLLKSDVYRLVHGKMLWVVTAVLVALSVLAAAMMHWVSSPEFLHMTATSLEMTVNVGGTAADAADGLSKEEGSVAAVTGAAAAASASGEARDSSGEEAGTVEGASGEARGASERDAGVADSASSASNLPEGRGMSLDEVVEAAGAQVEGAAETWDGAAADVAADDAAGADTADADADADAENSALASDELWNLVADNPEALSDADFEAVSRDMRTLASPADMLGDTAVSGGELAMVVSLVVALFFAQDFTTHFARNLVMDRRGRLRYYGEKLVLVGLLSAFFLVVSALAGAVSFAAAGFTYAAESSVGDLALLLGLAWLLAFAYGCATAVVVWATRSAGAGVAWALAVSSGIAGSLFGQVLLLLGRGVPWIGALAPWLPASCMQALGNNASTLLAAPAAAPIAMAPLAVQVLLVGVAMVALCAALTFGPLRRRDL